MKHTVGPLIFAMIGGVGAMMKRVSSDGSTAIAGPVTGPDDATPIPPLTERAVEEHVRAGGTDAEIAALFDVELETFQQLFKPLLARVRAQRVLKLRETQTTAALEGNVALLTWLGRNELGQSASPEKPGEPEPKLEEQTS